MLPGNKSHNSASNGELFDTTGNFLHPVSYMT